MKVKQLKLKPGTNIYQYKDGVPEKFLRLGKGPEVVFTVGAPMPTGSCGFTLAKDGTTVSGEYLGSVSDMDVFTDCFAGVTPQHI